MIPTWCPKARTRLAYQTMLNSRSQFNPTFLCGDSPVYVGYVSVVLVSSIPIFCYISNVLVPKFWPGCQSTYIKEKIRVVSGMGRLGAYVQLSRECICYLSDRLSIDRYTCKPNKLSQLQVVKGLSPCPWALSLDHPTWITFFVFCINHLRWIPIFRKIPSILHPRILQSFHEFSMHSARCLTIFPGDSWVLHGFPGFCHGFARVFPRALCGFGLAEASPGETPRGREFLGAALWRLPRCRGRGMIWMGNRQLLFWDKLVLGQIRPC